MEQPLRSLSIVVLRGRHIADSPPPLSATPPGSSPPVPCAPRRGSVGDERRTREVQTMDSVRGCVGGAALSPGIVAARLLCRCFVTDRKVACLVCAKPRPWSLGTFAIIRKNDRSAIKPTSKGALVPLRPFHGTRQSRREGKWKWIAKLAIEVYENDFTRLARPRIKVNVNHWWYL